MWKFLAALALLLPFAASAQQGFVVGPYNYFNMTTASTLTLKSGAGFLHAICINTPAAGTLLVLDSITGSGARIGQLTEVAAQAPGCVVFDVAFSTGLTLSAATAGNITASYR